MSQDCCPQPDPADNGAPQIPPGEAVIVIRVNNLTGQVFPLQIVGELTYPLALNALELAKAQILQAQLNLMQQQAAAAQAGRIVPPPPGFDAKRTRI